MKYRTMAVWFLASLLMVAFIGTPVLAEQKCKANKAEILFSPDPEAYKQVSKEEALKNSTYIPATKYTASIKEDTAAKAEKLQGKRIRK